MRYSNFKIDIPVIKIRNAFSIIMSPIKLLLIMYF